MNVVLTTERDVDESGLRQALDEFDRALSVGDSAALGALFAEDGRLLLQFQRPIEGRAAIRDHWESVFAQYEPTQWWVEYDTVEVHPVRAYVLGSFAEVLRPRGGGPAQVISGRVVYFWRRSDDGAWHVVRALNSHSGPPEEVP
jgi:uncharacterized protein (TIGR02246 family)